MKIKIKVKKEVDIKTLHVKAEVRYWEDATVNGVDDETGELIPCREDDLWCPIIAIDTGVILNWKIGFTANIHYKVCDCGSYYLKDGDDNIILSIEDDYVPAILCPKEEGYGDYIIMDVDANGKIDKWKVKIKDFYKNDE